MDANKYTAWNIGTEDTPCYVTVMEANKIFNISKVSRVDQDSEKGYQRVLSEKRANDIAQYLNDGNIIPGSIILSAQEGFHVSYNKQSMQLELEPNSSSLFVIDGQHRLWGASKCEQEIYLPVCIFTNLELKQEVQYFLDINSNQKGVPKTLRIELLKFLSEPDSTDEVLNRLFNDLGNDTSSALFNKISPTKSIVGKISHVPFRASIEPLIESYILNKFDYESKKTLLINYLNAVENTLIKIEDDPKRITSSAFFQAIFKIFEAVCEYSMAYFKNYKQSSFEEILSGIASIDFEKHQGSNQQAINSLAQEMKVLVELHASKLNAPEDLF